MNVELRLASLEDAAALSALATDAFVAAFGHLYHADDLNAFLAEHRTADVYRRELADHDTRIALAEVGGTLAGYALIHWPSEFAAESDASRPLALHQLYCAPGMTGLGTGGLLMEWALSEARALGRDAVQLSVWSENHAAQRFYRRYGFSKIADIGFMVGSHRDEEFLLELRL
jgi:ribosomal protein S18 acetylase RimI-like enzyme